jgi:hypothetical protein
MGAMAAGEAANFAAYAFAPALLVTPLGALSIIVSALLAHHLLDERLNPLGQLGCALCIAGSVLIVLHAPPEAPVGSVLELWALAMQPVFLLYVAAVVAAIAHLARRISAPTSAAAVAAAAGGGGGGGAAATAAGGGVGTGGGVLAHVTICSLAGSLTVVSVRALGIALKMTAEGSPQLGHPQTWAFFAVAVACVLTQMAYLNRALDLYPTSIVSPLYYAAFTLASIGSSGLMFSAQATATGVQAATAACALVAVMGGTFLLHATRDLDLGGWAALTSGVGGGGVSSGGSLGLTLRERRGGGAMPPLDGLPLNGADVEASTTGVRRRDWAPAQHA